mmetsp:Transcript_35114/g.91878  ORF Transcript_35114/g.91878 Transcript_35114/m.91878 type:complete len:201 (-) Transcript_35114:1425-2027(-)
MYEWCTLMPRLVYVNLDIISRAAASNSSPISSSLPSLLLLRSPGPAAPYTVASSSLSRCSSRSLFAGRVEKSSPSLSVSLACLSPFPAESPSSSLEDPSASRAATSSSIASNAARSSVTSNPIISRASTAVDTVSSTLARRYCVSSTRRCCSKHARSQVTLTMRHPATCEASLHRSVDAGAFVTRWVVSGSTASTQNAPI